MEKNIISCREYTPESEFDLDPMLEEAPVIYGSGKQRMWNTQESQKDAWVVTSKSLWVDDDEE